MKTLPKILLLSLLPLFSSCSQNKEIQAEDFHSELVEVPFKANGKLVNGIALDVDGDREIDGLLAGGYLLLYKAKYSVHPKLGSFYNPNISRLMTEEQGEYLSEKLKEKNDTLYEENLIK